MTPGARVAAAIEVLRAWAGGDQGLDRVLAHWGRAHRFAGGGDRRAIADLAYDAVRRLRSAGWVAGADDPPAPRAALIGSLVLDGADLAALFTGDGHAPDPLGRDDLARRPLSEAPEAVRLDLPDWVMPLLADVPRAALGRMRARAGLFLRVNTLKGGVEAAIAALAEAGVVAERGPLSPTCLRVTDGARRVAQSPAYAQGLVEIQDAASQAMADLCAARPGETVLDFCAGGGGKSLALAAAMENRGRLVAHDSEPQRLAQLGPRAARAGATVAAVEPGGTGALASACDLVLVDAPCSGSGAWARNPDAKWRLTPERLSDLTRLQDAVLADAALAVRPGGRLVYATCSLLPAENAETVARFLAANPDFAEAGRRSWTPLDGGDGFFAAMLTRAAPKRDHGMPSPGNGR